MYTIPLLSITKTTLPLYVTNDKLSDKPSIHPLQSSNGLPIFVPSIQSSGFPTHVPSLYSSSILIDGPYHLLISYTILNPSVSLSQTPYDPPSVHFIPIPSRHASTPPVQIKLLDQVINTVRILHSYQFLCLIIF